MVDYFRMFRLGAKQDNLGVDPKFHSVTRRPVEDVASANRFLLTVIVCDSYVALDQVAPMRRLAKIALESF